MRTLDPKTIEFLAYDWPLWRRSDKKAPRSTKAGELCRVWLILGGRGAGKTRTGAEWVRAKVFGRNEDGGPAAKRIALIGETLGDVRRVMVEGDSGLLNIHSASEQPLFERSKLQLTWPNGAVAQMFSAEEADSLRGPQFDAAWCDEIAKWRAPDAVWDMLQFALRLRRPWLQQRRGRYQF